MLADARDQAALQCWFKDVQQPPWQHLHSHCSAKTNRTYCLLG